MRIPKQLLSFAVPCLLLGTLTAQIPIGPFSRTYTANATRGFCFKVPASMIVTHLQVPDEAKIAGAKQVVALYRLPNQPPQFANTVPGTPIFYSDTANPGVRIPVVPPAIYQKDEWLVVLGGMGTATTTLNNSYGPSGAYASHVLGMPISLERAGMQSNLAAVKGIGGLYAITSGITTRVRVWVAGHSAAIQYGQGTGSGSNPAPELAYSDPFPPSIGKKGEMIFLPGTANNTNGILGIGFLRSNIVLPFGTLLAYPTPVYLPVAAGPVPLSGIPIGFQIPNTASLVGAKVTFQGAVGVQGGLTLTNGMEWVLGQ
jgi:hypothetical protein